MSAFNVIFGIANIACGMVLILVSLPLAAKKVPMNRLYGFRIAKAFESDENWYRINRYGGRQMIQWSIVLILIGGLYFVFPIKELPDSTMNTALGIVPIIICVVLAITKTIYYAKGL